MEEQWLLTSATCASMRGGERWGRSRHLGGGKGKEGVAKEDGVVTATEEGTTARQGRMWRRLRRGG
jgi:hypothetical protein